jgi:hypothetical protein
MTDFDARGGCDLSNLSSVLLLRTALTLGLAGAVACGDSQELASASQSSTTQGTTSTSTMATTSVPTTGAGTTTTTGAGATTTTTTGGIPPVGPVGYNPRWVLRDGDGVRVKALVQPRCHGSDIPCPPLEFGAPDGIPCVRVIDHESRYVNLLYDMNTGQLGHCMHSDQSSDIDKPWSEIPGAAFTNAQCEGTAYAGNKYPDIEEFTEARTLYFAENNLWLVSTEGCLLTTYWLRSGVACEGPKGKFSLCPLVVVPDWVQTLLPNPPYTMAVEYE